MFTVPTLVVSLALSFLQSSMTLGVAEASTLPMVCNAAAATNKSSIANSSAFQSAQKVAYVLEAEGRWLLNKNLVRAGETLYEGAVLVNSTPSENDRITIADLAGKPIVSRRCNVANECRSPITLPRPRHRGYLESVKETLAEVMSTLFGKHESIAVQGGVREGFSLVNGVGKLEEGGIDLTAAFKQKEAGRFHLLLVQNIGTANARTLDPLVFDWNPEKPSALPLPASSVGLYQLTLLAQVGNEYRRTNNTSWILITTEADYEQVSKTFQEMVSLTEGWGAQVTPDAKDRFLRASLTYLMSRQSK